MKKLNLNVADLGATEILSRDELKKVLGGTGTGSTGSGGGACNSKCSTSSDCGSVCQNCVTIGSGTLAVKECRLA